ncbi:MAG: hypothetical protein RIC03_05615 [Cyclobacteriaceae bacterium]
MAGLKWIPIDVIQFVLRNRMINEFKVYLLLNVITDGYAVNNSCLINHLSRRLNWTTKTVSKHINKLIERGWLGASEDVIYIRSLWLINGNYLTTNHDRMVEFNCDWFDCWKGYLLGAFLGHLVNVQQLKSIAETINHSGHEKGCSYQRVTVSASFPLSHKSIEKILGVTTTTAHEWKKKALTDGFVVIKHKYKVLSVKVEDYPFFKSIQKENNGILIMNGKVIKRLPDHVTPLLKYRSGKKKKYNRRGYKGKVKNH